MHLSYILLLKQYNSEISIFELKYLELIMCFTPYWDQKQRSKNQIAYKYFHLVKKLICSCNPSLIAKKEGYESKKNRLKKEQERFVFY